MALGPNYTSGKMTGNPGPIVNQHWSEQDNDTSNFAPRLWKEFGRNTAPSWEDISNKLGMGPRGGLYGGNSSIPRPRYATEAPIWSDQQIQNRVNLTNAKLGAQTQQNINDTYQNLGRYGFATNRSPLAMSLANQAQGRGNMAGAEAENNLRWTAAEGNAAQTQRAQLANLQASTQWGQAQGSYWNQLLGMQQSARENAVNAWLGARQNQFAQRGQYANLLAGLTGKKTAQVDMMGQPSVY